MTNALELPSRPRSRVALLALAVAACAPPAVPGSPAAPAPIARTEARIESEPGVVLALRRVAVPHAAGVPVLLVHGAGGGSVASFDVQVPGYSLAEDLARAGHPTYLVELPGATHFVFLDRPAHGRARFVETLLGFLARG